MSESEKPASGALEPAPTDHEPRWRWRSFLRGGVLLAGVLALGLWGYWRQQNADLLGLSARSDWQGEIWDAKSQDYKPLTTIETRSLVLLFSRAHEFHRGPNFSCATCVYYGSPRYYVRLTAPGRTELSLGVWASGRLAWVWNGRMYSGQSRWIEFGGGADEIELSLEAIQKRIEKGP